jgi:hypothetical protein
MTKNDKIVLFCSFVIGCIAAWVVNSWRKALLRKYLRQAGAAKFDVTPYLTRVYDQFLNIPSVHSGRSWRKVLRNKDLKIF